MAERVIELTPSVSVEIVQDVASGELGGTVWDAALTMVHSLANSPKVFGVAGKVLDLSCGTGVCGIAAARLFPKTISRVDFVDLEPLQSLIRKNVEANGLPSEGHVHIFKWGDNVTALNGPYDFILASDVVVKSYANHYASLLKSLWDLSHDKTEIFLAVELRDPQDKVFFEMLPLAGFSCEREVNVHPGFVCDEIRLFRLRKAYADEADGKTPKLYK